jgi:two-component system response regulator RegX3
MTAAPATTGGATRVLVVEDEESYRTALELGLRAEGFEVETAADGPEGLRSFARLRPDVVLLDMMLPGLSGTEVCQRMLAMAPVPIIVVSARGAETDVVVGLEIGAADYVVKPFHLRELVARIQAVLRRVTPPPGFGGPQPATGGVVVVGPVAVDMGRREVRVDGRPVNLSRREFDLLALLVSPPGQVRSRDELIDRLWVGRDLADNRTLDTHVRRLRLKLERDPAAPELLRTVRGVGFRFDAPTAAPPSMGDTAAGDESRLER